MKARMRPWGRPTFASVACIAVLVAVAWIAVAGTDPAVQLEQTDLYIQDVFAVPLDDHAVASQVVRAAGLTRVDVLAQADEASPLRLRVIDEGDVVREETVTIPATETRVFIPIIFPILDSEERRLELRFDSPRSAGAPALFGSTCDCLDGGSMQFDPGSGVADVSLKDLHLGTFTVKSQRDRLDLVLDRASAYAPRWLGTPTLVAAMLFTLLLASAVAGMTLAAGTRDLGRHAFIAVTLGMMTIPIFVQLSLRG